VVAEGDFVAIHGRYFGWGPRPMVAVDIFRVANGKIAEHWDVMQEEVSEAQSANGNSMLTSHKSKSPHVQDHTGTEQGARPRGL
jgi:hypothetical protein